MSEIKWIKLTVDMFDDRKIKAIRKLPEGNNMILIWVMLLSLAGRCNASGMIFLTENIPYTNKMLSDELGFEESVICIALDTFERFGMISRDENLLITINNWSKYQAVDGMNRVREQTRKRVENYRKRKKQQQISGGNAVGYKTDACFSSSKSNAENLRNILNQYEEYKVIKDDSSLFGAVGDWMTYKDEKKPKRQNHYDTEMGIRRFLNKILSESKKSGTEAVVNVINDSIASNYQGVVWDRIRKEAKDNDVKSENRGNQDYAQKYIDAGGTIPEFTGF